MKLSAKTGNKIFKSYINAQTDFFDILVTVFNRIIDIFEDIFGL